MTQTLKQQEGGHRGRRGGTHSACVVDELEVGLRPLAFAPFGLEEVAGLAQVVVIERCLEGGVGGLGEDALFLQDGEDAHGLEGRVVGGVTGGHGTPTRATQVLAWGGWEGCHRHPGGRPGSRTLGKEHW